MRKFWDDMLTDSFESAKTSDVICAKNYDLFGLIVEYFFHSASEMNGNMERRSFIIL